MRNPYITRGGTKSDLLGYQSTKTVKGEKLGYVTAILYLAPHQMTPGPSLCPFSSPGCRSVCLQSSGQLRFSVEDRKHKTMYFRQHTREFIDDLAHEIELFVKRTERPGTAQSGLTPCVRLNGTSDILWERIAPELFEQFSTTQFYDYTKIPLKIRRYRENGWPKNYWLTYSLAEESRHIEESRRVLASGLANVAIPFPLRPAIKGRREADPLPARWGREAFGQDFPVIDGDVHDLRFLDRPQGGAIVGLRAKGEAQKSKGEGFVVALEAPPDPLATEHHNHRRRNPALPVPISPSLEVAGPQQQGGMTNTNPRLFEKLWGRLWGG